MAHKKRTDEAYYVGVNPGPTGLLMVGVLVSVGVVGGLMLDFYPIGWNGWSWAYSWGFPSIFIAAGIAGYYYGLHRADWSITGSNRYQAVRLMQGDGGGPLYYPVATHQPDPNILASVLSPRDRADYERFQEYEKDGGRILPHFALTPGGVEVLGYRTPSGGHQGSIHGIGNYLDYGFRLGTTWIWPWLEYPLDHSRLPKEAIIALKDPRNHVVFKENKSYVSVLEKMHPDLRRFLGTQYVQAVTLQELGWNGLVESFFEFLQNLIESAETSEVSRKLLERWNRNARDGAAGALLWFLKNDENGVEALRNLRVAMRWDESREMTLIHDLAGETHARVQLEQKLGMSDTESYSLRAANVAYADRRRRGMGAPASQGATVDEAGRVPLSPVE